MNYKRQIKAFAARNSGPVGDTKYDIFDQAGLTRAQMRRMRMGKVKRYPQQHYQRPYGSDAAEYLHPKRVA